MHKHYVELYKSFRNSIIPCIAVLAEGTKHAQAEQYCHKAVTAKVGELWGSTRVGRAHQCRKIFRFYPRGPKNQSLPEKMCPVTYGAALKWIFLIGLLTNFESFSLNLMRH